MFLLNPINLFSQSGQKWATDGNNISNGDYLGTKNAIDLDFKVNQVLQLKITTAGEVIVQDKLIVNNNIKANYLAGNGFTLLQADNNGNIQPFPFPANSGQVLYGNGTWGYLPEDNGWMVDGNNMYSIPTGNVGIGIYPTKKLDVNGSALFRDSVGIGLTNPQAPLDVQGNVIVRGWLYAQNGVVVGKRFEGQKVETDTVETEKSISKISETDTLTSEKINAKEIKAEGLIINGNTNKIYSTAGNISFNNTNLNDVGTLRANSIETNNLNVSYTDFDSLHVTEKIKIGLTSLYLSSHTDINGTENSIYTENGNLLIQSNNGNINNTIINSGNTGYVGIGTGTPEKKLHVKSVNDISITGPKGSIRIEDEYIDQANAHRTSTWDIEPDVPREIAQNQISFSEPVKLNIGTPGLPVLTLLAGGRVGIGTQNPDEMLQIEGQYAKAHIGFGENYLKVGYNAAHAIIESHGTDAEHGKLLINWYSGNDVVVGGGDNSNECTPTGNFVTRHSAFLATIDGNVGIGTTAPAKKLHVKNFIDLSISSIPGEELGSMRIEDEYYDGTTTKSSVWDISPTVSLAPMTNLILPSEPVKLNIGTSNNPVITLLSNKKLGIGTETPKEALQIGDRFVIHDGGTKVIGYNWDYASGHSNYIVNGFSSQLRFHEQGTISMVVSPSGTAGDQITTEHYALNINNDGNVGIGTTNPQATLHLKGQDGFTVLRIEGSDIAQISFLKTSSNTTGTIGFSNFDDDFFMSNFPHNIRISAQGNIGLGFVSGQVAPSEKVEIGNGYNLSLKSIIGEDAGDILFKNSSNEVKARIWSNPTGSKGLFLNGGSLSGSSPTTDMMIDGNGKVGIGTITPDYKLDVCGTIRSKELIVETGWCDYVFNSNYKKMTWQEKEKYYFENKHLFGVDSEKEIETNGLKVAKNLKGIVLNVEENSLDIIELYKIIIEQKKEIDQLKKALNELKKQ